MALVQQTLGKPPCVARAVWEVLCVALKEWLHPVTGIPWETHFFSCHHVRILGFLGNVGAPFIPLGKSGTVSRTVWMLRPQWALSGLRFYIWFLEGSETCKFPSETSWELRETYLELYSCSKSDNEEPPECQGLIRRCLQKHGRMWTWSHCHFDLSQLFILISYFFFKIHK